jgi:hypothetical protein
VKKCRSRCPGVSPAAGSRFHRKRQYPSEP